jgi:hypothetical protein
LILYLSESRYYKFKANSNSGTDNFVELIVVPFLLMLAMTKKVYNLQVYGDSMLLTKWLNNEQGIHINFLQALAKQIKVNTEQFTRITFIHVYKELNSKADTLSKDGLQLRVG